MLPVAWLVFALQYRAIAKWEASFIRSIYGPAYDEYAQAGPGLDAAVAPRRRARRRVRSIRGATCSSASAARCSPSP